MAEKLDFKKEYKELYQPGAKPSVVKVPPILFLMVDGEGAPEGQRYQEAVELLYGLSYSIKMSKLSGEQPEGVRGLRGTPSGGPLGAVRRTLRPRTG